MWYKNREKPTGCARRCTSQVKWLSIVLRRLHGFCDSAELLPRHQQASDVTKFPCEAAPHHTACRQLVAHPVGVSRRTTAGDRKGPPNPSTPARPYRSSQAAMPGFRGGEGGQSQFPGPVVGVVVGAAILLALKVALMATPFPSVVTAIGSGIFNKPTQFSPLGP